MWYLTWYDLGRLVSLLIVDSLLSTKALFSPLQSSTFASIGVLVGLQASFPVEVSKSMTYLCSDRNIPSF